MTCCDACARRSWLVGRLATHLEVCRGRRSRVREVLALDDLTLIEALGGRDAHVIGEEWARFDAGAVRVHWMATGTVCVCSHDHAYPAGLRDLSDAPAALHVLGDVRRLGELAGAAVPAVAIVGARRASDDGQDTARRLGRGLSAAGVTVVSGMALGIDSAAHEGALDAGARTIAVLACGPERAYPARRRLLHERIAARALVISELPPGTAPFRWAFPARNRIIAGLAEMTVIVEAAERSGSLITAEIAADLGRDVGATPGSPSSWHSSGANALLRDGARVVRHAVDVLDDVIGVRADEATLGSIHPSVPAELAPDLRAVIAAVDAGRDTVAANTESTADAGRVLRAFTELELLGIIERRPGGRYVRSRG